MRELRQAEAFYNGLDDAARKDLAEAIAADIYFLDETLQEEVLTLLERVSVQLKEEIEQINGFTIR